LRECPRCGRKFNWLQRAIGEDREHYRNCCKQDKDNSSDFKMAASCRGCPAGCFEGSYPEDKAKQEGDTG